MTPPAPFLPTPMKRSRVRTTQNRRKRHGPGRWEKMLKLLLVEWLHTLQNTKKKGLN